MSEIEVLEEKLQRIKNIITDRIKYVNDSKLPGKIEAVVKTFGEDSDWGGGEYHYFEKGLSIKYVYHSQNHLSVDLGYDTKEVFRGKLLQNGVADVYLYVLGDWEKRSEELYNNIPEVEKKRKEKEKIENLQNDINELSEKWQLEDLV